jgi:hypothetical protein
MSRVVALPYLTAKRDRVAAAAWLGPNDQALHTVADWDYGTGIRASRGLEIDVAGVRGDCGLSADARLAVTVVWRSTRTAMRGALPVTPIPRSADHWTCELRLRLEGAELGGELRLLTRLLLAEAGSEAQPLAPDLAGALLWEDRHTVLLEGGAARFPMEVIDFRTARLPAAEAAWYLHWPSEDLHQPVLGALRLYLNEGHPTIRALVNGELNDELGEAVLSTRRFDTARALITGALADNEFLEDPNPYDAGSVGATLRRLANAFWPDQTLTTLQNHLRSRPDAFHTELQERMRLLFPAE